MKVHVSVKLTKHGAKRRGVDMLRKGDIEGYDALPEEGRHQA